MTVAEIKSLLKDSKHPVARVCFQKDHFKVLLIGFLDGMILKDHQTPYETKLLVLEGKLSYKEGEQVVVLNQFEEHPIPSNIIHSVTALTDSICMLIQA